MEDSSEATLIKRFRNGDEEAFRRLFEPHVQVLAARIRRWLPAQITRKVSIADVLQEARLIAFRRRADFEQRGDGAFRAWLFGIVERKASETARKYRGAAIRAVDREVTRGQRVDTAQFVARGPSPMEAAIAGELKERVRRALETLPPSYREVIRLAREEHLSMREAAERMGRSRDAVKKLYGRALCRLKEVLDE